MHREACFVVDWKQAGGFLFLGGNLQVQKLSLGVTVLSTNGSGIFDDVPTLEKVDYILMDYCSGVDSDEWLLVTYSVTRRGQKEM
jgi:hypothetical protein